MKLSVALCTYNGEAFLGEQLASIARQGRLPDEVVVCDDRSSDRTAEIVRNFADSTSFQVAFHTNDTNLGSTKNFEAALARCSGDIAVLADLDVVCQSHKLQRIEDAFARHPDAAFVFSDAQIVDESLQPQRYTLWDAGGFGLREKQLVRWGEAPSVLLRYNVVTGATLALRTEYRDVVLPIPEVWVHDGWIALLLSMVAPCAFIDEPLLLYRQHSDQQLGGTRTTFLEKIRLAKSQGRDSFARTACEYEAVLERTQAHAERVIDPRWITALGRKVAHFRAKARMRED